MEFGIIIKNIVIIGVILGVVFVSQQPWFLSNNKVFSYSQNAKNGLGDGVQKAGQWFSNTIYPRTSTTASGGEEAEKGSSATVQENQKNNFWKNSIDGTKKVIAQDVLKLLGVSPQELGCQAN